MLFSHARLTGYSEYAARRLAELRDLMFSVSAVRRNKMAGVGKHREWNEIFLIPPIAQLTCTWFTILRRAPTDIWRLRGH